MSRNLRPPANGPKGVLIVAARAAARSDGGTLTGSRPLTSSARAVSSPTRSAAVMSVPSSTEWTKVPNAAPPGKSAIGETTTRNACSASAATLSPGPVAMDPVAMDPSPIDPAPAGLWATRKGSAGEGSASERSASEGSDGGSSSENTPSASLPAPGGLSCNPLIRRVYDVRCQPSSMGRSNARTPSRPGTGGRAASAGTGPIPADSMLTAPPLRSASACSTRRAVASSGIATSCGRDPSTGSPKSTRCSGEHGVLEEGAHQATTWPMARVNAT